MANKAFLKRVSRGRKFEAWERLHWKGGINDTAIFEAPTQFGGKNGRVDIKLDVTDEGQIVIVEIKATDWDRMKADRVRPNALRHASQIWRYIEAHLTPKDVIPAIVYPSPPKTRERREQIETLLNEKGIQVVWREEYRVQ